MTIDWEQQWALYAPNFKEGYAHIDLGEFGLLKLAPGGGFGDFSHPTTRLMLKMMPSYIKNKIILDIGCGSGILTLAALQMGGQKAIGTDIEKEAIIHSRRNLKLNNSFAGKVYFNKYTNEKFDVVLMNMISSEQKIAWPNYKFIHHLPIKIITSGILKSDKQNYLSYTKSLSWQLIEEIEEEDWLAFAFTQSK